MYRDKGQNRFPNIRLGVKFTLDLAATEEFLKALEEIKQEIDMEKICSVYVHPTLPEKISKG